MCIWHDLGQWLAIKSFKIWEKKSREEEEEGKEKQEARMFAEKLDCRLADWLQEFP